VHLFARVGVACEVVRNDVLTVADAKSRALAAGGLVISPGPGTPEDAGIVLELLNELAFEVPVFGVCLGHQALGQHFGGRVVRADRRMHGRVSAIEHAGSGVFSGLPSPLSVTRYHSLVVEREGLSEDVEVTAFTAEGDVMGLRHRVLPAEGVQFHPESFLSERGAEMLASFAARLAPREAT
jgi:anthranilate synthase component 2